MTEGQSIANSQKLADNGQRLGLSSGQVVVHHHTVELLSEGELILGARYALVEVPYEPGTLEVVAGNKSYALSTADRATACVRRDDYERSSWLISRLWLEDANGVLVMGAGEEIDVSREGWQLVAAGSAGTSTEGAFASPVVHVCGQVALAIYRRA